MRNDGWGFGHHIGEILASLAGLFFCFIAFAVLAGVLFLLVRFLLVATRAASIYVAKHETKQTTPPTTPAFTEAPAAFTADEAGDITKTMPAASATDATEALKPPRATRPRTPKTPPTA
jgi:hypothetical protein